MPYFLLRKRYKLNLSLGRSVFQQLLKHGPECGLGYNDKFALGLGAKPVVNKMAQVIGVMAINGGIKKQNSSHDACATTR
ncbi:hypothetical protein GCM10028773_34450 [Spirosoma koreense]